ncbi:membrane protein [Mycobacterium phage Malec]|uniref:Membrane protein n=1 Tax=Mycobacterium phage Malec TaxID=2500574 RepID=A0A3Q9R8X8_9CAUD|nr:membrane protein [Mycobacterium phage Malec]AZV00879.1 membrane protein [Mycobacterium phage Malec]
MKKYLITAAVASVTTIGVLALADDPAVATPTVPFTQAAFPCQEDEVLGYAPQFGPDNVGCIHVDLIKR